MFQNPESARSSLGPVAPARVILRDQFFGEAQHPALGVRRAMTQPHMQHLAGVRARGHDRVIPKLLGVPEPGALLLVAAHLADEAVDVDDQPAGAGASAGLPRPRERLTEDLVELANMPEGERPQERAQRRGRRDPAPEQPPRAARSQHLAVIDAVGAQRHRVDQRHHLPARVRRTRTIRAQAHTTRDQRLQPQPPGERRDQRDPRVRDDPVVVKTDPHAVQSDRPVIVHHQGDPLRRAPAAHTAWKSPAQGVTLTSPPDTNPRIMRWIQAE